MTETAHSPVAESAARQRHSLLFRLLLLVLLGTIPPALLVVRDALEQRRAASETARETARSIALHLAADQEFMVEGTRSLLEGLADEPAFKRGDTQEAQRLIDMLFRHRPYLFYANFGLIDLQGNVTVSAIEPKPGLNLADRDYFRETVRSRGFSAGRAQIGRITGKKTINFGYPVTNEDGALQGVVFAALDLDAVKPFFAFPTIPKGSSMTFIDAEGSVLQRFPDASEWMGKKSPDTEIIDAVLSRRAGTADATGLDGVRKHYGFTPVGGNAGIGYVYVGIPEQDVRTEANRRLFRHLAFIGMAAAAGFLAVWFFMYVFVQRRVKILVSASQSLASGNLGVRTGFDERFGELGQLGKAFDEMAHTLETRQRDAEKAHAALLNERQNFLNFLEAMEDGVHVVDGQHNTVYANPALERDFGPYIGKKCHEYFHDAPTPCENCHIAQVFAGKAVRIEWTSPKTGKTYDLIDSVFTQADGSPAKLDIFRDITDKKIFSDRLRESEEKLNQIVSITPVALLRADHRKLIWMNQFAVKMFGFDNDEEWTGKSTRILFASEEEFERAGKALYNKGGNGEIPIVESVMRRKDGSTFQGELRLSAPSKSDPMIGATGVIVDVTQRKKGEERLRESERRFRETLQNLGLSTVQLDSQGIITFCNRSLLGFSGWTQSELMGKNWFDFFCSPDARDRALRKYCDYLASGRLPVIRDSDILTKTGEKRNIRWFTTVLNDASGLPEGIASIGVDITESLRYEQALKEAEERMRLLIEASPIGIAGVRDGRCEFGNPSLTALFGLDDLAALTDKPFVEFVSPGHRDLISQVERAILDDAPWSMPFDFQGLKRSGEAFDLMAWVVKINYGGRAFALFFLVDVTESKQLRAQLTQAQKMEAIGTLAGGIAHDFNNILTVIVGFSEILLSDKTPEDHGYKDLVKINAAGMKAADLVKRLLLFSRKGEAKKRPLDLNRQVEEVAKLIGRTIPPLITIDLSLEDDLPPVLADPTQVEQIVMNLAVNARDAMPHGGKLVIETSHVTLDAEFSRLHLGASLGPHVLLAVSDTGSGMDRETLNHIFEPFFTTKAVGKGTGLGLSTVYGIVKQHDGYIHCKSEPGTGTTFRVFFPVASSPEMLDASEESFKSLTGTETVLLVDDEVFVRDIGRQLLSRAGYTVLTASNGAEAIEMYRARIREISLVVLDLMMPVMGGEECLEELLRLDPEVKTLIASGYTSSDTSETSMYFGAQGFVSKPYKVQELLAAVREILDHGSMSDGGGDPVPGATSQ